MTKTFRTEIEIDAPPEDVFEYFVRPDLLVRWMGDFASLSPVDGGLFAVDINGVLIRGSFVRIEPHSLIEIAWGEAGNDDMPPGATRVTVRFTRRGEKTLVQLEHTGLSEREASKHAIGWPHFVQRLRLAASGGDPGADPWATSPPE